MNKKIIIIGIIILTLVAFGFLLGSKKQSGQLDKEQIMKMAQESKEKQAKKAQAAGYPSVWTAENLPQYPNAELRRVREVMGTTMVTLETEDSVRDVAEYYKTEMQKLGYSNERNITNDFVSMLSYKKDDATLSINATHQKKSGKTKIQLDFKK